MTGKKGGVGWHGLTSSGKKNAEEAGVELRHHLKKRYCASVGESEGKGIFKEDQGGAFAGDKILAIYGVMALE